MTLALPKREEIPAEHWGASPAAEFVERWFFEGAKAANLEAKPGVDTKAVLRAIGEHLRSWDHEHSHKIAGCALLVDQHFRVLE